MPRSGALPTPHGLDCLQLLYSPKKQKLLSITDSAIVVLKYNTCRTGQEQPWVTKELVAWCKMWFFTVFLTDQSEKRNHTYLSLYFAVQVSVQVSKWTVKKELRNVVVWCLRPSSQFGGGLADDRITSDINNLSLTHKFCRTRSHNSVSLYRVLTYVAYLLDLLIYFCLQSFFYPAIRKHWEEKKNILIFLKQNPEYLLCFCR